MEGRIDRIDVKREHRELIALFYYIELKFMLQKLLYDRSIIDSIDNISKDEEQQRP